MTNFINKLTEFAKDFETVKDKIDILRKFSPDDNCFSILENSMGYLQEEVKETSTAILSKDNAEILDGAGDVAFIALNIIYKWGIIKGLSHKEATWLITEVMNRICDANLNKRQEDGTIKFNMNGKVTKPEGWQAPEYDDIIESILTYGERS